MPQLQGMGAAVQWLDVNGDGIAEPIVSDSAGITTYSALQVGGFGLPERVSQVGARDDRPVAADAPERGLFLVDMNGDGLADLVQVGNGRIQYWPHLGHGRFGAGVMMDDAPVIAPDGEYDPARLRFVDLDGSGTADMVYLGRGEIRRWTNASGNRFLAQPPIPGLPYLDRLSAVDILDLLGDGRPCLVWSTPLPGHPVRYAPLTAGVAPRLLVSVANSMGAQTTLEYGSSAAHLLRDRARGRDWHSRMSRHHVVVDRMEVIDHIAGGRAVTRYEYHDGYFDGEAFAQRGFGLVDSYDADSTADDLAEPGAQPTPAACVRTWMHTGAVDWSRCLADAYRDEPALPMLDHSQFENLGDLAYGEYQDGLRCLAGRVMREETYAVEPSGVKSAYPFHVSQFGYQIRRVQSGVLRADQIESLHHCYEGQPTGARITQNLVAESDDYGNPLLTIAIGHGSNPVAAATRNTVASFDQVDRFEVGIPVEMVEY
jgi:hypothetical protein